MGQAEIIKLLQRVGTPLTARQISNILGEPECKINKRLSKMIGNAIECEDIDRKLAMKLYKSKRCLRIYFLKISF